MTLSSYIQQNDPEKWRAMDEITVEMRGPLPSRPTRHETSGLKAVTKLSLRDLFGLARESAGGYPLNIVVHDCEDTETRQFLNELGREKDSEDDVWLICTNERQEPEITIGQALDLRNGAHKTLYGMIEGDLVFFSGQRFHQNLLPRWRHRARFVLVQGTGQFWHLNAQLAEGEELRTFKRDAAGQFREL